MIKKKKKTPPTDDEIVELVKELLEDADLEKVTMKSVCKQVHHRIKFYFAVIFGYPVYVCIH